MKTTYKVIKGTLLTAAFALMVSCGGGQYANSGTASDRTGANGATNGNGKAPTDNTHNFKY
ncbi:MAG: hypothetical protein EOO48_13435 [Flavobacterium sp.]|nr:MAG: hypothetical protein EOO48_13435 [Flavobacterium sp.]